MKVLHVFKTYLPDSFTGIERVIWEIAENTRDLGVETEVLSVSTNANPIEVPVGRHLSVRARQDFYVASTGISRSLFREFKQRAAWADVIHYHFPWPMMDLLQLMTKPRRPTVVTYHSDIVRQKTLVKLYAPLMHGFLKSVDRIVATSPNYLKSSDLLKQYSNKVTIVPIGISEQPAVDVSRLHKWKARVGEGFFLFVGALRYYKGISVLLRAAKENGLPVVVAGKGEEEDIVRSSNLPRVTYVGAIEDADKWALLALCSAFVFPSNVRSEAFGVALLEAARAGRAMISCEIGTGTSFVNQNGKTGLVVPPNDPHQLAAAMTELFVDVRTRNLMSENARARYVSLFRASKMADEYSAIYAELEGRLSHKWTS